MYICVVAAPWTHVTSGIANVDLLISDPAIEPIQENEEQMHTFSIECRPADDTPKIGVNLTFLREATYHRYFLYRIYYREFLV